MRLARDLIRIVNYTMNETLRDFKLKDTCFALRYLSTLISCEMSWDFVRFG